MDNSQDLFAKATCLIPGGVNSPVRAFRSVGGTPFFTARADGPTLTDIEGRELIDFVSSWGPGIHGHNHPTIRRAISEALERGTSFGTPNPYEVEMAQLIVDLVPSVEKVRMCNSGTEATMTCLRLARGYTGRPKIIKFAGCYHGHVDSLLVKAGSGALTFGTPDSAGIPESVARETLVCPLNDLDSLQALFADWGDEIAAIIIEPYPANNCLIVLDRDYLRALRHLCTDYGSLLIFDEVMTGFRVAPGGVQEKERVIPDLTALGKIIGGGLPVGAFGGKAEIIDSLAPEGPVYQAGTLSGNPLAMAAGIASLRLLVDQQPYRRLDACGRQLAQNLHETAIEKGLPVQVPQVGSMFSVIFSDRPVIDFESASGIDTGRFKRLFRYALEHGIYLPPSAYETCFISTAHSTEVMGRATEILQNGIRAI